MRPPDPTLEHVCDIAVRAGTVAELGDVGVGDRRVVPIVGGTVDGPLLRGRVVGHGSDWQTIGADGVARIDARYLVETDDGATIEVHDRGMRHGPPGASTMRTALQLTSGDDRYDWLNRTVFVGSGIKTDDGVVIAVHAVR